MATGKLIRKGTGNVIGTGRLVKRSSGTPRRINPRRVA